jgi:hypothetical protein
MSTTSNEPADTVRNIPLPGERQITIRPVRSDDDVRLMNLYDTLDGEDRRRRFFTFYRPALDFYTGLATVADHGGGRLVAELHDPAQDIDDLVGEAGYSLLPNGDGELAMVVARPWRGWLGPYLLDALVDLAAASGVPNLEADVLAVNRPMLAILRSRGCVMMDHDGWSEVRLLIGTRGRRPTWPGPHERIRVLAEGTGGRWHAEDAARAAGLQLLACPGPSSGRRDCPALSGQPCPLAAGADVIVVSRPPDADRWHDLLAAHADVHPGVPICLEPAKSSPAAGFAGSVCPAGGQPDVVSFVTDLARHDLQPPD